MTILRIIGTDSLLMRHHRLVRVGQPTARSNGFPTHIYFFKDLNFCLSAWQGLSHPPYASVAIHTRHQVVLIPVEALLEQRSKLFRNGIADFRGLGRPANVLGSNALFDDISDCFVNFLRKLWLLQRVLEHHRHGQKHCDWVDDALAADVRRRTYTMSAV